MSVHTNVHGTYVRQRTRLLHDMEVWERVQTHKTVVRFYVRSVVLITTSAVCIVICLQIPFRDMTYVMSSYGAHIRRQQQFVS